MEKNIAVALNYGKLKGSSLVIVLGLLSFLSLTFFYWNKCYQLQVSSYQYAMEKEEKETKMDLALSLMKRTNKKYHICVDNIQLEGEIKWRAVNHRYIGVFKHDGKFYGLRGLPPKP